MEFHKRLLAVALLISVFPAFGASLCHKDEKTYFSCTVKGDKTISLCGSTDVLDDNDKPLPTAWLQYRFGTSAKLELVYPITKTDSVMKFESEYHHPYHGFVYSLIFVNDGVGYTLDDTHTEDVDSVGIIVGPPEDMVLHPEKLPKTDKPPFSGHAKRMCLKKDEQPAFDELVMALEPPDAP